MKKLIDPFWLSTTAYAESVVRVGDGSRSIEANLLFPPDTILAVTNAAADVWYGADRCGPTCSRERIRTIYPKTDGIIRTISATASTRKPFLR